MIKDYRKENVRGTRARTGMNLIRLSKDGEMNPIAYHNIVKYTKLMFCKIEEKKMSLVMIKMKKLTKRKHQESFYVCMRN